VALNQTLDVDFAQAPDWTERLPQQVKLYGGVQQFLANVRVDLLQQRISIQPAELLRAQLRYQLVLDAPLRGLDGSTLGKRYSLEFTTGTDLHPAPTAAKPVGLELILPLFEQRCSPCHTTEHRGGLALESGEGVGRTLVNVPSARSDRVLLVPGAHAKSYLMHKLVGTPNILGDRMPPPPRAPLSEKDLRLVADWIDSGAP
jgi:hypothetical protein